MLVSAWRQSAGHQNFLMTGKICRPLISSVRSTASNNNSCTSFMLDSKFSRSKGKLEMLAPLKLERLAKDFRWIDREDRQKMTAAALRASALQSFGFL